MSRCSSLDIMKLQSFAPTDFHVWKLHVKLGMKERGIFYTVLSDYATTREDVNVFQWGKDDVLCRDYLRRSLNPRLAMTYNSCKIAKEIWDCLNARFQEEEGSLRIPLSEQFFDLKFDTNSPISSQIVELEKLCFKLADEQSDISDSLFVSLILHKLPPGWFTFRLEEQTTLEELKRLIRLKDQYNGHLPVDNPEPRPFVAMVGSSHRSTSSEWWLDSGATCHVTNDRGLLSEVVAVQEKVEDCNGGETDVTHAGTAELVLSSGAADLGGALVDWDPDHDDLLDSDS